MDRIKPKSCRTAGYAGLILLLSLLTSVRPCPDECSCDSPSIYVDCSSRRLSDVPSDIPSTCQHLNLADNLLTSLPPSSVGNLTDMIKLDLSMNQLASLEPGNYAANLRIFSLRANQLTGLSSDFLVNATFLRILDLSANKLDFNIFQALKTPLPNLQDLNLADNPIGHLPYLSFKTLTGLKDVNLSGASLNSMDSNSLIGLDNLLTLDLSHNDLRDITRSAVQPINEDALGVGLSDNPLICSCNLAQVVDWLDENSILLGPGETLCSTDFGHISIRDPLLASFCDPSCFEDPRVYLRVSRVTSGVQLQVVGEDISKKSKAKVWLRQLTGSRKTLQQLDVLVDDTITVGLDEEEELLVCAISCEVWDCVEVPLPRIPVWTIVLGCLAAALVVALTLVATACYRRRVARRSLPPARHDLGDEDDRHVYMRPESGEVDPLYARLQHGSTNLAFSLEESLRTSQSQQFVRREQRSLPAIPEERPATVGSGGDIHSPPEEYLSSRQLHAESSSATDYLQMLSGSDSDDSRRTSSNVSSSAALLDLSPQNLLNSQLLGLPLPPPPPTPPASPCRREQREILKLHHDASPPASGETILLEDRNTRPVTLAPDTLVTIGTSFPGRAFQTDV